MTQTYQGYKYSLSRWDMTGTQGVKWVLIHTRRAYVESEKKDLADTSLRLKD